jgi:hypothetical protein
MLTIRAISTWDPDFVGAIRRHYTKSRGAPPGKKMAWELLWCGVRVGWWGYGEPAYKLAPRRALGLLDARPPDRCVSNFIFRLERETVDPPASKIIKLGLPMFAAEWEARYGWAPEHIETMVDAAEVKTSIPGYAYRRAGFRCLGETTGRTARRPAGNAHGPRVWSDGTPKVVLYHGPLHRVA